MGYAIDAIPTRHFGINFRSRIEARWARFFMSLDIPFEYEPRIYSLKSGRYIPDFFLPHQSCFFEVKPYWVYDTRHRDLAIAEKIPVVVACSDHIPGAGDTRAPITKAKLGVFRQWTRTGLLIPFITWGLDNDDQPILAYMPRKRDHIKLLKAYSYARDYSFPRPKALPLKDKPHAGLATHPRNPGL